MYVAEAITAAIEAYKLQALYPVYWNSAYFQVSFNCSIFYLFCFCFLFFLETSFIRTFCLDVLKALCQIEMRWSLFMSQMKSITYTDTYSGCKRSKLHAKLTYIHTYYIICTPHIKVLHNLKCVAISCKRPSLLLKYFFCCHYFNAKTNS